MVMNEVGKPKISVVERNYDWGLYVWRCSMDGSFFGDREGNVMNIPGRRNDLYAMSRISQAAKHYGAPEGSPHFIPGQRRVDEDTHIEQKWRLSNGLIPSENDLGAWMDAAKGIKEHGEDE